MTTTLISLVEPGTLRENQLTIHRFLRESYTEVSRHIQESLSFFRDEFKQFQHHAGICFNNMMLPVNNFLKDPAQIEKEFMAAPGNKPEQENPCTIVPIEIALLSPMEEN